MIHSLKCNCLLCREIKLRALYQELQASVINERSSASGVRGGRNPHSSSATPTFTSVSPTPPSPTNYSSRLSCLQPHLLSPLSRHNPYAHLFTSNPHYLQQTTRTNILRSYLQSPTISSPGSGHPSPTERFLSPRRSGSPSPTTPTTTQLAAALSGLHRKNALMKLGMDAVNANNGNSENAGNPPFAMQKAKKKRKRKRRTSLSVEIPTDVDGRWKVTRRSCGGDGDGSRRKIIVDLSLSPALQHKNVADKIEVQFVHYGIESPKTQKTAHKSAFYDYRVKKSTLRQSVQQLQLIS